MTVDKKLKAQIKEDFDEVFDIHEDINFVEVMGRYCGDPRCYRYYNNGMITER